MNANPFRGLPSVHEMLQSEAIQMLAKDHAHGLIVDAIRKELTELRHRLSQTAGGNAVADLGDLAARIVARMEHSSRATLRPIINATGIILHTNLGRAPLAEGAARAAYEAAHAYLNLEIDLETGKRSSRQNAIRELLCRLTGAEAATAVNNNAAATVIALRALCQGKEVIISRGQLIEIGGSFRIPEIMGVSGAMLREVGTTNITRLTDYECAISPISGALMRVHSSNYRISGFTSSVTLTELAELGKKRGLAVIDDIGSGALIDFAQFGFHDEPIARESIAAGADLVLFSGDKLLGGPQAGILAGRKDFIQKIEKDPLMRAFRLDKMTLAALEATLRLYLNEARARIEIPGLRMLAMSLTELRGRADALALQLRQISGIDSALVTEDKTFVGGGSLPDQAMETVVIQIKSKAISDAELAHRLRTGHPPVLGRLRDGQLLLDLRTVFPSQETLLIEALRQVVSGDMQKN